MADAREWLDSVSESARMVAAYDAWCATVRANAAIAPSGSGSGSKGSVTDKYAQLDAVLSSHAPVEAQEHVAEALAVLGGLAKVGRLESEASGVLVMRHVSLMPFDSISAALGCSKSTVRRRYDYGIDWLDAHGLAHAKHSSGMAS